MTDNVKQQSKVVMGCMRIAEMATENLDRLIRTALECGVNTFDHADIYGGGKSEELFGEVLASRPSMREEIVLQSKCGIRQGWYDLSKEHILESVDGILQRLHTDYLDTLVLHSPVAFMEPEEIGEVFDILLSQGKVRHFGVSNMNAMQIAYLQNSLKVKLEVNQLQLSVAHSLIVDEGINVNLACEPGQVHTGSVLDYCRLNGICVQSWSSLQYGFFEGTFLGSDKYPELNRKLEELSEKYHISTGAVAIAWILRIPGVGQSVVGTTKPSRMKELAAAADICMDRKDWYDLYLSAGRKLP